MIHIDSVVAAKPALVVEVFDDAMLIWDEETGKLHHLEAVASTVWCELDGEQPLRAIAAGLTDRYAGDPVQIRGDVVALVGQLHEEGLLTLVNGAPTPCTSS